MQFVVLSSSRGTTFQAIIDAIASGSLTADCRGLISDSNDRGCVAKAHAAGIPVQIVTRAAGEDRETYDKRLDEAVRILIKTDMAAQPVEETVIAAIGWMFILTPWLIERWKNRILNVHPALLPKHGGKGMYGMKVHEEVLRSGDSETGITIHLMDQNVDTGPILVQKSCSVLEGDTPELLRTRVQELEKEWYPGVLQMIDTGEIRLP